MKDSAVVNPTPQASRFDSNISSREWCTCWFCETLYHRKQETRNACFVCGRSFCSGEHGIGLEKQEYMPLMFTDEDMQAMDKLKLAFATNGRFNPGKIFPTGASRVEVSQSAAVARTGADAYI